MGCCGIGGGCCEARACVNDALLHSRLMGSAHLDQGRLCRSDKAVHARCTEVTAVGRARLVHVHFLSPKWITLEKHLLM